MLGKVQRSPIVTSLIISIIKFSFYNDWQLVSVNLMVKDNVYDINLNSRYIRLGTRIPSRQE